MPWKVAVLVLVLVINALTLWNSQVDIGNLPSLVAAQVNLYRNSAGLVRLYDDFFLHAVTNIIHQFNSKVQSICRLVHQFAMEWQNQLSKVDFPELR